jgi:hypothetical protein
MEEASRPTAAALDRAVRALAEGPPDAAVADLTAVANRAIIELHKIARAQSAERRGAPDWGAWARLANAARGSVLQIATVRDSLKALQPPPPAARDDPPATQPPAQAEGASSGGNG